MLLPNGRVRCCCFTVQPQHRLACIALAFIGMLFIGTLASLMDGPRPDPERQHDLLTLNGDSDSNDQQRHLNAAIVADHNRGRGGGGTNNRRNRRERDGGTNAIGDERDNDDDDDDRDEDDDDDDGDDDGHTFDAEAERNRRRRMWGGGGPAMMEPAKPKRLIRIAVVTSSDGLRGRDRVATVQRDDSLLQSLNPPGATSPLLGMVVDMTAFVWDASDRANGKSDAVASAAVAAPASDDSAIAAVPIRNDLDWAVDSSDDDTAPPSSLVAELSQFDAVILRSHTARHHTPDEYDRWLSALDRTMTAVYALHERDKPQALLPASRLDTGTGVSGPGFGVDGRPVPIPDALATPPIDAAAPPPAFTRLRSTNRVWNPIPVVRWSLNKRAVFKSLSGQKIPLPHTIWVERNTAPPLLAEVVLAQSWKRCVMKAVVQDANFHPRVTPYIPFDVLRTDPSPLNDDQSALTLAAAERDVMLQPFLDEVTYAVGSGGEWSIVYFNGEYSHSVRKYARGDALDRGANNKWFKKMAAMEAERNPSTVAASVRPQPPSATTTKPKFKSSKRHYGNDGASSAKSRAAKLAHLRARLLLQTSVAPVTSDGPPAHVMGLARRVVGSTPHPTSASADTGNPTDELWLSRPLRETCMFIRVDIIDARSGPVLIDLELTDPLLYLQHPEPERTSLAIERFYYAIVDRRYPPN